MTWRLPADFEAVSSPLADLPLCAARLMNDAHFVWVVLVPRREGVVDIDDLLPGERHRLLDETIEAGRRVRVMSAALDRPADKLNIAQLGNITRPLHVHVIARRPDDAAWPRPVWGVGDAEPWRDVDLEKLTALWSA